MTASPLPDRRSRCRPWLRRTALFPTAFHFVFALGLLPAWSLVLSSPAKANDTDGAKVEGKSGREAIRSSVPSFELDVLPVLTARGCNAGPCHGKARGQNGFKLSLFGYDSDFDHAAIVGGARGRRVFFAAPASSLLLRKATGEVPHGGGVRLHPDEDDYRMLLEWIAAGAPRRVAGEPQLTGIDLKPRRVVAQPGMAVQLTVTAHYSDGSRRDVTRWTTFSSNEPTLVRVVEGSEPGRLQVGKLPGEATIMARYLTELATTDVAIPLTAREDRETAASLPVANFIDQHIGRKLQMLRIIPSASCDESTYLRRVYLDLIGRLPTPDEARDYLEDSSPDKRARLVDRLLERPEYADHWANHWVDLLRPNPYRVGIKAVYTFDEWIRRQFRENRPYDAMVRELLTAQGSTWHHGAVTLFRDRRSPEERTAIVSQLFLGIRLECAKCHHHPFERWSQRDYYSFAAFFSQVKNKGTGLSPPISGSEEFVYDEDKTVTQVRHPVTGEILEPRPLFGQVPPEASGLPLRQQLAAWITSPENPFFAQVAVNRVWAELMGVGLVEPVDDLRTTNPPSNPELLEALAADFVAHGYDFKHLLRRITASQAYQLSSSVRAGNGIDHRNYSRHYRRRLRAEVLLQAIDDVTETEDRFSAMPLGSRPHELWTHRIPSVFLDTFGRPDPNQDPPCERLPDTTVTQALHLMNADHLQGKIADPKGRIARMIADRDHYPTPESIIEELYLACYARFPEEKEVAALVGRFPAERSQWTPVAQDLLWALLNTPEFLFKD